MLAVASLAPIDVTINITAIHTQTIALLRGIDTIALSSLDIRC
jgi:hypothetical protein